MTWVSDDAVAEMGVVVADVPVVGQYDGDDAVEGQQPDWAEQQRTAAVDDWDWPGWSAVAGALVNNSLA